jgi:DNA-binding response OmpR family regulator
MAMRGMRLLVVEDEYLVAEALRQELVEAGASVIGPVPSVAKATVLLEEERDIDCAVLDINLAGETVFELADALQARGVPFLFVSGYTTSTVPSRFAGVPLLEKPVDMQALGAALAAATRGR